jgi:hypothetical protein
MSNIISLNDNDPTMATAESLHDAFLGEVGQQARRLPDPPLVAGEIHQVPEATHELISDTREEMEYTSFYTAVPDFLRQDIAKAVRERRGERGIALLAYAANELSVWGACCLVNLQDCLELASLYDGMLRETDGHLYQFCKQHMGVEIVRVLANRIEKRKPTIRYSSSGGCLYMNITLRDGGKSHEARLINGNDLRSELEFRAKRDLEQSKKKRARRCTSANSTVDASVAPPTVKRLKRLETK